MKKNLLLFLSLCLFFLFAGKAHASDNFSTYYNVFYQAREDQTTAVTLNIDLKNKTSEYYASSYTVQTGFDEIKSVSASDLGGNLSYKTIKGKNGTQISFNFNKSVVGIGNVQKFKIYFETDQITKNFGNIWEVNIPGLSNQDEYITFNVDVVVPASFGPPTIIKPSAKDFKFSENALHFSKADLGKSGVSIAYGTYQVYNFDLGYHLQNKNLFPIETEIAIPANNSYQEVKIEDINPRPLDVYMDSDGNWLAKYKLGPSKKLEVSVTGVAKLSYKPKSEALSALQIEQYTSPQKYWESNDPNIKKLAESLKTPEKIYRYIVDNLSYDSKRVNGDQIRAGGANTLSNKNSAVCLEFTDLFIALARASGIPARAVEGYANTDNSAERPLSLFKDVLHAWPEYYDREKHAWVMVDPTWENTTRGIDYFNVFDFDHFAFVIKGESSDYPIPAGGYKIPGEKEIQDVFVKTSRVYGIDMPSLSATTDFNNNYVGGLGISGEIIVENLSGVMTTGQTIAVESKNLTPKKQYLYLDRVPPFGKRAIAVKFEPRPILTNEQDTIKISIGKGSIEKSILISPFYKSIYFIGGLIIAALTTFISIIIYRSRRLSLS